MLHTQYVTGAIAAGEAQVVYRDKFWKPNAAITPVVYCHHATGGALTPFGPAAAFTNVTEQSLAAMIERLTVLGHPCISADQAGDSWGNDTGQTRLDGSITQISSITGCSSSKVLLLADSMGSVIALNWARANPTKVAAIAILLPIPDLTWAYSDPGGNVLSTGINTAYGGAPGYTTAQPTHNPALFPGAYKNMQIKLWYCDNDAVGSASQVSSFVTAVKAQNGSGFISSESMGSFGHTIDSSFNINKVTDFLHARG